MKKALLKKEISQIVKIALKEDSALRDITSDSTIPQNTTVTFEIRPREEIIFCGKEIISETFLQLKKSTKFKKSKLSLKTLIKDGDLITRGKPIAVGRGDAKLVFAAERVMLNIIQHLSGTSTLTNQFITKLSSKNIQILDTRKTLPSLRILQKYAVLCGGGKNHRQDLSDMILIKDNHIAAAGNITNAILGAKAIASKSKKKLKIEIECDNYAQVLESSALAPDIIMLDNMPPTEIKKCSIAIRKASKDLKKKIQIEVSGGINLENIKKFSKLDIDFISIGALTHSAKAVDIGLDIIN